MVSHKLITVDHVTQLLREELPGGANIAPFGDMMFLKCVHENISSAPGYIKNVSNQSNTHKINSYSYITKSYKCITLSHINTDKAADADRMFGERGRFMRLSLEFTSLSLHFT